jgi:hypothetical protein
MSFDVLPTGSLRAPLLAAIEFGLPEEEAWAALAEVFRRCAEDEAGEDLLEELSAVLAARILERERSAAQLRRSAR